jgi:hypothetical protein
MRNSVTVPSKLLNRGLQDDPTRVCHPEKLLSYRRSPPTPWKTGATNKPLSGAPVHPQNGCLAAGWTFF